MNEAKLKQYKDFNVTVIILGIMMILLPVLVYIIRWIYPDFIRCLYYDITLKPCPFCGFTTDIRNIIKGNIFAYKYNILSVPFIFIAILEILYRIYLFKNKIFYIKPKIKKIKKIDIILHIILFVLLLIYILFYFIFDLRRF